MVCSKTRRLSAWLVTTSLFGCQMSWEMPKNLLNRQETQKTSRKDSMPYSEDINFRVTFYITDSKLLNVTSSIKMKRANKYSQISSKQAWSVKLGKKENILRTPQPNGDVEHQLDLRHSWSANKKHRLRMLVAWMLVKKNNLKKKKKKKTLQGSQARDEFSYRRSFQQLSYMFRAPIPKPPKKNPKPSQK